jgi:hypothetical protein
VASEETGSEDQAGGSHEPRECMACRGTGRVISNLGGAPQEVTCPWCDGSGVRVPGIDAQARWPRERSAEAGEDAAPETAGEPSVTGGEEDPSVTDGEEVPSSPSAGGPEDVPPAA